MYSYCDERSETFPYEVWLKRPGGSSTIMSDSYVRYSEKEKDTLKKETID
jgi:hypothetical protein